MRPDNAPIGETDTAFDQWTPERVAATQPRDIVIDNRGLGYLRGANGALAPMGTVWQQKPAAFRPRRWMVHNGPPS